METEARRLLQPLWNALERCGRAPAVLCVSGGPDSRALLEAVARWQHREGFVVATVDHKTRPESAAEARAVAARATALGFDVDVLTIAKNIRGEGPLRAARYRALEDAAKARNISALMTAHHAGDLAEGTLLATLGHGGGREGAAMSGDVDTSGLRLLRPFLELSRDTLRLALTACDANDVFVDPDHISARAKIRRDILVPLGAQRADVEDRLATLALRRRDEEEVLMTLSSDLLVDEGALVRPGPIALVRRALMAAVRRADPAADPRDAAPGLEVALALIRARKAGHVDLAGVTIDVDPDGTAKVAARGASTHDGEARLSGKSRMATVKHR
jgi:tRNA(Ile)-lysidine synthetase-like protein